MTQIQKNVLGAFLASLMAIPALRAAEVNQTMPIGRSTGAIIVKTTYWVHCTNYTYPVTDFCCLSCRNIDYPAPLDLPICDLKKISLYYHDSCNGSVIDNGSFNHMHYAVDFRSSEPATDCKTCGGDTRCQFSVIVCIKLDYRLPRSSRWILNSEATVVFDPVISGFLSVNSLGVYDSRG